MTSSGESDPSALPPRQIVVCCDGTNNTLSGGVRDTSVVRVVEMLSKGAADMDERQLVYYDPGVGVPAGLPPAGLGGMVLGPLRKLSGLGLGQGVYENIGEAYLFLCREYGHLEAAGATGTTDEIYLFGFSRGAFTVRCVAGMVNLFGLIRPEHEQLLPTLLRVYFSPMAEQQPARVVAAQATRDLLVGAPEFAPGTREAAAEQIKENFASPLGRAGAVHFLGVWDTVQSVGLPGLRKEIKSSRSLEGKKIVHTRHAMSLDEHRRQFLPRTFKGPLSEGQTLRQLWFRGVHADVGGGGPAGSSRLSDAPFWWMLGQAEQVGLRHVASPESVPERYPAFELVGDQLSKQPAWTITGMALRDMTEAPMGTPPGPVMPAPDPSTFVDEPREHSSVAFLSPPTEPALVLSPWQRGRSWRRPAFMALAFVWALVFTWLAGWEGSGAGHLWPLLLAFPGWLALLGLAAARGFARRTLWRRVGDPFPALERLRGGPDVIRVSPLGNGVPVVFVGGLVGIVVEAIALSVDWTPLAVLLHVVAGVAGLAALIGIIGVAVLVVLGLAAHPPQPGAPARTAVTAPRPVWQPTTRREPEREAAGTIPGPKPGPRA